MEIMGIAPMLTSCFGWSPWCHIKDFWCKWQ